MKSVKNFKEPSVVGLSPSDSQGKRPQLVMLSLLPAKVIYKAVL
jgi:hypothetical protein